MKVNRAALRLALRDEIGRLKLLEGWRARLGRVMQVVEGAVQRSYVVPTPIFTLPGGCELHGVLIYGEAGSNAGTAASIDVGTVANPALVLSGQDVKGNAGAGQFLPRAILRHGPIGPDPVTVVGTYAETGTPSSAGGPWWIVALFSLL